MNVTESSLALIVAATFHTEAALRTALAKTPITVLVCVAVLCVGARVTARVDLRGKRTEWTGWDEERVCCVSMALRVDRVGGYGVPAERVV